MTGANGFNPPEPGYLYEAMAEHLVTRIETGELAEGKPLPNERRLSEEYGVSLGTARHAVHILARRGLVVVVRSKGTYVVGERHRAMLRDTANGNVDPP